jgi:hypothetical protein
MLHVVILRVGSILARHGLASCNIVLIYLIILVNIHALIVSHTASSEVVLVGSILVPTPM